MRGNGSPKKRKPQRLQITFPFPVISANKLWIQRGKYRVPSGYYNKFKKRFFSFLEEQGYQRGCLNLNGNLKITMDVGFSNKRSDLDNAIKGVLDCLVAFFGKWDDSQITEIHMKKFLVPKGQEYFKVLLTKTRRKI